MTKITLCDTCAPAVVNDDWTALDAHDDPAEADAAFARISAMLEILGWLTPAGDAHEPGYFDCAVCAEIQCGGGHAFTAEGGA